MHVVVVDVLSLWVNTFFCVYILYLFEEANTMFCIIIY